jgi:hypothetical protein
MSLPIQKIHNWFYNHTAVDRKKKATVTLTVNTAPAVGAKTLTEEQLYSKKYYQEHMKPLVELEMAANVVDPKTQIAIRAKIMRECYERECDTVKEEIRKEKEKADQKRRETLSMLQSLTQTDGDREFTPEEYDH